MVVDSFLSEVRSPCLPHQAPSPAVERAPAPAAAPSASTAQPQFVESVMAIRTPSCFVKGVIETVSEQALKDTLISRFGPLKEVDIVRNVRSPSPHAAQRSV